MQDEWELDSHKIAQIYSLSIYISLSFYILRSIVCVMLVFNTTYIYILGILIWWISSYHFSLSSYYVPIIWCLLFVRCYRLLIDQRWCDVIIMHLFQWSWNSYISEICYFAPRAMAPFVKISFVSARRSRWRSEVAFHSSLDIRRVTRVARC